MKYQTARNVHFEARIAPAIRVLPCVLFSAAQQGMALGYPDTLCSSTIRKPTLPMRVVAVQSQKSSVERKRPRPGGTRSRSPTSRVRHSVGHGSGVPTVVPGAPRRSVGHRPRPAARAPAGRAPRPARAPEGRAPVGYRDRGGGTLHPTADVWANYLSQHCRRTQSHFTIRPLRL